MEDPTTSEAIVKPADIQIKDPTSFFTIFNLDNPVHWSLQKIRKIHGEFPEPLPDGYAFRIVPSIVEVASRHGSRIHLSKSSQHVKSIAAIIQLLFACVTLYRTRGDQATLYGYAAYGLSVIPYAIMSLINLSAHIVAPDYPALYMVRSEVMDEAEARGGHKFDGTVGMIQVPASKKDGEHTLLFTALPENADGI